MTDETQRVDLEQVASPPPPDPYVEGPPREPEPGTKRRAHLSTSGVFRMMTAPAVAPVAPTGCKGVQPT